MNIGKSLCLYSRTWILDETLCLLYFGTIPNRHQNLHYHLSSRGIENGTVATLLCNIYYYLVFMFLFTTGLLLSVK